MVGLGLVDLIGGLLFWCSLTIGCVRGFYWFVVWICLIVWLGCSVLFCGLGGLGCVLGLEVEFWGWVVLLCLFGVGLLFGVGVLIVCLGLVVLDGVLDVLRLVFGLLC